MSFLQQFLHHSHQVLNCPVSHEIQIYILNVLQEFSSSSSPYTQLTLHISWVNVNGFQISFILPLFFFYISVLSLHFLWLPRSKSSAQRMESHQRCYINTGKNKQAKKDPHEEVVNTQLVNVQKRFCTFGKYIKIISAERYAHTHFVRICLYIPTYSELRKWSIFCNSETILADDREVIENLVT